MKNNLYYFDDGAGVIRNVEMKPFPSEMELLKIFPEAKEIISQKINEWLRIKGKLLAKKLIPALKAIDFLAKGEDLNKFLKTAYFELLMPDRFYQAVAQLKRLRRLENYCADKPNGKINLDEKKQKAKEVSILSLYPFAKLRKEGGRYKALCPFHTEKERSFVIYPNNTFHCFGCGISGDSIELVRKLKNYSFPEAVLELAGVA